MAQTARQLLGRCLARLGVERVYGDPVPDLRRVPIDEPLTASLLASADGRIGPGLGAALSTEQVLQVTSEPGASADPHPVAGPEEMILALSTDIGLGVPAAYSLRLDFDLDAPVDPRLEPETEPADDVIITLSPEFAEATVIVLAGPGIPRGGHIEGLAEFASRARCGVLNTWGAKGVFRWDSPHHFGTAGLQERDFELAGLSDADLVVASGIDGHEAPRELLEGCLLQEVEPWQLAALVYHWHDLPERELEAPALYRELSAALAPFYESDATPLTPARAAAVLSERRTTGSLVVADPGLAGLWIARAFPTTEPGSVVVPATVAPGFAAAAAVVAGLAGRHCTAVTTDPIDEATLSLLDLAVDLDVPVRLEVWGDGPAGSYDFDPAESGDVNVVDVGVDFSVTQALVDVAGPVIAWPSLAL